MIDGYAFEVLKAAHEELQDERFRKAVDELKEEINTHKPWYVRVFPWRIRINIERV